MKPENNGPLFLNPLNPKSDEHLISPHNITACSNIQAMRIKERITKVDVP